MFGTLEYDGDGNLIARLKLYSANLPQPEIARVSVAHQLELLDAHGVGASYENLDDEAAATVVSEIAATLTETIENETNVKPYVNPHNGHADLISAVRLACEPGGCPPSGEITFRVTV